jgi:hypothetical protein
MSKQMIGTWNVSGTAGHYTHGQSAVYDDTGKDIAIVYDGKAHGPLIASAPDLLAALRMGVELSERNGNGGSESQAFRSIARAAIARAEA